MKLLLSVALVTSLIAFSGFSAKKTSKKSAKRSISSQDLMGEISKSDQKLTNELNAIVNSVRPAKLADGSPDYERTSKDVRATINKIVVLADKNPSSDIAQLYKAAVIHIPLFKGFVYRLRKIAEVADMTYLSAIWSLKQVKQTSNFRAPYMEALFDLVTMPNDKEDILGQKGIFESVSELQNWMITNIAPRFTKTIDTMRKIAYKSGNGIHPIGVIKAELLVGEVIASRYEPAKNAHKEWLLTSGHLIGLVSGLEYYMGTLYYASSYNLEKLAELSNTLTKETYVAVSGPTSRSEIFSKHSKRVELLSTKRVYELTSTQPGKKKRGLFGKNSNGKDDRASYKAFMTIRPEAKKEVGGHKNYLQASKHFFTLASKDGLEYHRAMVESYGVSGESQLMVNPTSYRAALDLTPYIDNQEVLEQAVAAIEANGPITLEDKFLNKKYTVDVSVLFDVDKVADLRAFLPNKFLDSNGERNPSEPNGLNWFSGNITKWKKSFSWNYSYNKATGWQDPTFAGLLPNIESEKQGDDYNLHFTNVSALPETPFVALWLSMFFGY